MSKFSAHFGRRTSCSKYTNHRFRVYSSFHDLKCKYKESRKSPTYDVVFLRHGQSTFNADNLFCGWHDSKLTKKGQDEAKCAGQILTREGFKFDLAFTSLLTRIANVVLLPSRDGLKSCVDIERSWRLNERHYGALTGKNKDEVAAELGAATVHEFRRSYKTKPPEMEPGHPLYRDIMNDVRYKYVLNRNEIPVTESLHLTLKRTVPYWIETICPYIRSQRKIVIVAHGSSLRSIVKYLDKISDEQITKLEIPTGIPFVYTLDRYMKPVRGKSLEQLQATPGLKETPASNWNVGRMKVPRCSS